MTELHITRGREIGLYLNGEALCGVTHFSVSSRFQRQEFYEYLSAEPYDAAPSGESHELRLKVLSLFGAAIPDGDRFTLTVVDGDTAYLYEGCTVTGCERDIRGDKAVTDRYLIKANKMTKRRNRDDR